MVKEATIRGRTFTTLEQVKIRNLYLAQSATHEEIAIQLSCRKDKVSSFITRSGLSTLRKQRAAAVIQKADTKLVANLDAVSAEIADECEEIALAGLKRAKESTLSIHKDAAKDFQAWTAGIRNLTTARAVMRNANVNTLGTGESAAGVNLFFFGGSAAREPRKVEAIVPRGTVDDVL